MKIEQRMRIQRSRSLTLILLLFCALPPFSSGLKWFVSPPREESGLTSVNFSKARDQLEQNLSGKVFLGTEGGKSANSEGTDRGLGGRREPKQFRLLSNFSDLIQSNSRLAPSDTFCKFFIQFDITQLTPLLEVPKPFKAHLNCIYES